MRALTNQNFGVRMAYALPGFVVLCNAGCRSSAVDVWLNGPAAGAPIVGGFLCVTPASLATVARRSRRPRERAANRLAEELRSVLITINTIRARLPKAALYLALKHLRLGIITDEHVANDDLRALVRQTRRAQ